MTANVVYRCQKCGSAYRPTEASRLNFWCCGQELIRGSELPQHPPDPGEPAAAIPNGNLPLLEEEILYDEGGGLAQLWKPNWRQVGSEALTLVEVIPPRNNSVDALQAETLLGSLLGSGVFSLEIAADAHGCRFLVRAPHSKIRHIQSQIQAVYDQAQFVTMAPERDPAQLSGLHVRQGKMKLRRTVQLPLRTFRDGDFLESDPMRGLLGAYGHLESGERVLGQIVLAPAPRNWSDRYQGSTRRIDEAISGESPKAQTGIDRIISGVSFLLILVLALWGFLAFLQGNWLGVAAAGILFVFGIVGMALLYTLISRDQNMDPILVQRKIGLPAYDVALRLTAAAPDPAMSNTRLETLMRGYGQYNLSSGNALEGYREEFDPRALRVEQWSWWQEFTGRVTRLNIAEIASLWHLPTGEGAPLVARQMSKKLLPPRPELVSQGVLVGRSVHQGREIAVHLPEEVLDRHSFAIAKTQQGKSTLMARLARAAMERDMAVIVIDPHGDLVRALAGMVPAQKVDKTVYLDFSDDTRIVGLNLLDMAQGRPIYAIIENLVHVGKLIWQDYWGPRMEDALRYSMHTLLEANEKLYAAGEDQFTILDIPMLFTMDPFRRKLLAQYVQNKSVLAWWGLHYEQMPPYMRVEVVNPVHTKIHRFEEHKVVERIVGQSSSTLNLRHVLTERQILLVNTANRIIGPDAGGLLGSILLDNINFAIGEQMRISDPAKRAKVFVVIDEFQSLPGVDYPALLAELQKMGASFVLATQALKQLDELGPTLRASILSNVSTLFVFQTSAEDADLLRHELDDEVEATDIINLERHTCYVKTSIGNARLPIMHVETEKPAAEDPAMTQKVRARVERYTRPVNLVEQRRSAFWNYWYGREMNKVKGLMLAGITERDPRRTRFVGTSLGGATPGGNSGHISTTATLQQGERAAPHSDDTLFAEVPEEALHEGQSSPSPEEGDSGALPASTQGITETDTNSQTASNVVSTGTDGMQSSSKRLKRSGVRRNQGKSPTAGSVS